MAVKRCHKTKSGEITLIENPKTKNMGREHKQNKIRIINCTGDEISMEQFYVQFPPLDRGATN